MGISGLVKAFANDAPVLSGLSATGTFIENNGAVFIDTDVTLTDANTPAFSGGNVTLTNGAGLLGDVLDVGNGGTVTTVVGDTTTTVRVGGIAIGTFANTGAGSGRDGASLIIALNANATIARVESLIESLSFNNTGANPTNFGANGTRTLNLTVNDGAGATSAAQTTTVTLTGVNDLAMIANLSFEQDYTEDQALDLTDIVITDPDSQLTATLTVDVEEGTLSSTAGGTFDAKTGVFSVTGTAAVVNAALAALTFTPVTDFNGVVTIETSVVEGDLAAQTGTITLTGIPQADDPVAVGVLAADIDEDADEPVTFDLLDGASDPDGTELSVVDVTYTVDGEDVGDVAPEGVTLTGSMLTLDATDPSFDELAAGETGTIVVSFTIADENDGTLARTATFTVTGVNDRPILTPDETLVADEALQPGEVRDLGTVGTLFDLDGTVVDVDSAMIGAAITGVFFDGTGTAPLIEYSLDGGETYFELGEVSETSAVLLSADALLRATLNEEDSGGITITFRAWDGSVGEPGESGVDTTADDGDTSAFSAAFNSFSIPPLAIRGTSDGETLAGGDGGENIFGLQGADCLVGNGGNDVLVGDLDPGLTPPTANDPVEDQEFRPSVAAQPQITTITFDSGDDVGDTYTVTIAGRDFTYTTVDGGNTVGAIIAALAADIQDAIDADDSPLAGFSVAIDDSDLVITGPADGTPFTATPVVDNITPNDEDMVEVDTEDAVAASPAVAQVTTVTLTAEMDTVEVGDSYSVTITPELGAPATFTYTVQSGTETLATALTALQALINSNTDINEIVSPTVDVDDGALILTAVTPGVGFTVDQSGLNALVGRTDETPDLTETTIDAVEGQAPEVTVELIGTVGDFGDEYSITITADGQTDTFSVKTDGSEMDLGEIATALAAAINADAENKLPADLTATATGATVTINRSTEGEDLLVTAEGKNRVTIDDNDALVDTEIAEPSTAMGAKQVSTILLAAHTVDANDTYTITIDNKAVTYTALDTDTESDVLDGLEILINGDLDTSPIVTASVVGGELVLTADMADVPFTVTVASANATVGLNGNDDAAVLAPTQANVEAKSAIQQVSKLNFDDTGLDNGDKFEVTIDPDGDGMTASQTFTVFADGADTAASIAAEFQGLINASTIGGTEAGKVTATVAGDSLVIAAGAPGTPFTLSGTVTNAVAGMDTSTITSSTTTPTTGTALNLTTGSIENTVDQDGELATAQVGTITLGADTYFAGDQISVEINPDGGMFTTVVIVTVTDEDANVAGITKARAAQLLSDQINADLGTELTADFNAMTGVVTITANVAGTPFTFVDGPTVTPDPVTDNADPMISTTDAVASEAAVQEVEVIDFTGKVFNPGDEVSVKIDGDLTPSSVTAEVGKSLTQVLDALVVAINGDGDIEPTAMRDGNTIKILGKADGTALTVDAVTVTDFVDSGAPGLSAGAETPGSTAAAESFTITLPQATYDAGDVVKLSVDVAGMVTDVAVTLTATTKAAVAAEIATAISTVAGVTAVAAMDGSTVTITAAVAGTDINVTDNSGGMGGVVDVGNANAAMVTPGATAVTPTVAVAQTEVITVGTGGSTMAGDIFTIMIDPDGPGAAGATTFTKVLTGNSSPGTIATILANAINADGPLPVTATRSGNTIILSADVAGTPFTVMTTTSGMGDSLGVVQATANVSGNAGAKQTDTIDLGVDTYDVGDMVTVTINGVDFVETVTVAGTTAAAVAAALVADINADMAIGAVVNAAVVGNTITLESDAAGISYTVDVDVDNGGTDNTVVIAQGNANAVNANQQQTITIGANVDPGDVFSFKINGTEISYTAQVGDDQNDVVDGLIAAIPMALVPIVNATNETAGALKLVADNPGVNSFTVSDVTVTAQTFAAFGAAPTVTEVTAGEAAVTGMPQVSTIDIGAAAFDEGDVITITIQGFASPITYTVTDVDAGNDQSAADVALAIVNLITNAMVTGFSAAVVNTDDIQITGPAGTTFTVPAVTTDRVATVTTVTADEDATPNDPGQPDVETFTIGTSVDVGDKFTVSITVDGVTKDISYTAMGGDDADDVAAALRTAIDAEMTLDDDLTVTGMGNVITLTGVSNNELFEASASITEATVQVTAVTVALQGVATEAGDSYTVAIDLNGDMTADITATYVSADGDDATAIADILAVDIEAQDGVPNKLTVSSGDGVITVTANATNTSFTILTNSVVNRPEGVANPTQPAFEAVTANQTLVKAQKQTEEITLSDETIDVGDTYKVTIDGTDYTYTVAEFDDLDTIGGILAATIDDDPGVSANYADGVITLEAEVAGIGFTAAVEVTNRPAGANDNTVGGADVLSVGKVQVSTVTLEGTVGDQGDVYTIAIDLDKDGTAEATIEYETTGAEANLNEIATALAASINANVTVNGTVTATAVGGTVEIEGDDFGDTFDVIATGEDVPAAKPNTIDEEETRDGVAAVTAVQQSDVFTLTGTPGDVGDSYTITIDGNTATYETTGDETTTLEIAEAFAAAIDALAGVEASASEDGGTVAITIAAEIAGTGYTIEDSAADNATVVDNAFTAGTPTANVVGVQQQIVYQLGGTVEAGDTFTVDLDGEDISYTVLDGDTLEDVAVGLADAIEASGVGGDVTAMGAADGTVTVTADAEEAGAFTVGAVSAVDTGNVNTTPMVVETTPSEAAVTGVAHTVTVKFDVADGISAGEVYEITIDQGADSQTFKYTASGFESITTVLSTLRSQINLSTKLEVSAVRDGTNLIITADTAGADQNFTVIGDVTAGKMGTADEFEIVSTKTGVTAEAAVAEVTTITIVAETIDAGDVYAVTVGGDTFTYTANGTDTADTIAVALADLIDEGTALVDPVVVDNVITLTAATAGLAIDITATATDTGNGDQTIVINSQRAGVTPVQQVANFTVTGAAGDTGDVYSITINGTTVGYTTDGTEGSEADIAAAIAAAIEASDIADDVIATNVDETVVITATTAGTGFTVTGATVTDVGTVNDNEFVIDDDASVDNVPAAAAIAEQTTVTIDGVVGQDRDTYAVTLDFGGTIVEAEYVTTGMEADLAEIRDAFLAAINTAIDATDLDDDFAVGAAAGVADGEIVITGKDDGSDFTVEVLATAAGDDNDVDVEVTNPSVVPVLQQTDITFDADFDDEADNGDSITVELDFADDSLDASFTFTFDAIGAVDGQESYGDAASALADSINALYGADMLDTGVVATVVSVAGSPTLRLTGEADTVVFGVEATSTNRPAGALTNDASGVTDPENQSAVTAQPQVSVITFDGPVNDPGDTYRILIDGDVIAEHTAEAEDTLAGILSILNGQIPQDGAFTSAIDIMAGTITLTSTLAGVGFGEVTAEILNQTVEDDTATGEETQPGQIFDPGQAEIIDFSLGDGDVIAGTYVLTVNGTSYTVNGTDGSTVEDVLIDLANAVEGDDDADVTAEVTGDGNLRITGDLDVDVEASLVVSRQGSADTLIGGDGADAFLFTNDTAADVISDFSTSDDLLLFDAVVFQDVVAEGDSGSINGFAFTFIDESAFVSGAGVEAATDEFQRFIYDETSGELRYDADGIGDAAEAILIATLDEAPGLTAANIALLNNVLG